MGFISWNVNGLRAIVNKNFLEVFHKLSADFFRLQGMKLQTGQIDLDLPGYCQYRSYTERKGYSGIAIFTKKPTLNTTCGMGTDIHNTGDRLITLEYSDFFLVACYTPDSQNELKRLNYRSEWEEAFYNYLENLKRQKPVTVCGDLNVAHQKIDLKDWKTNQKNAEFTPEERAALSRLLDNGFINTFRCFYPAQEGVYPWWNYRFDSGKNNVGRQVDYFLTGKDIEPGLADAKIHASIMGSDHRPAELNLK